MLLKVLNIFLIKFKNFSTLKNIHKVDAELDQEKQALKKLETQALNAKYEMKIQYLEIEIDTLRSKIRKLLKVI